MAVLAHLHHPIREPFEGGLEAHTAQVCCALAARGHRVTLLAKEGSEIQAEGVEVVPVLEADFHWGANGTPGDTEILDEATARACRLAAEHDAVLNNCLNPVPYEALGDAAMLTVLHTPGELERVAAIVSRPGWEPGAFQRWVSVSEANAAGWRRLLPGTHVGVVHNGIDLTPWQAHALAAHSPASDSPLAHASSADVDAAPEPSTTTSTASPLRERGTGLGAAGSSTDSPYLAWSARITPEKGLHVAIDAAVRAGLPLHVAGPVSDPEYHAREIAPRVASTDLVTHVGHLDHARLADLLSGASAFLCTPLWEEPFGLAPLEAMACGTPVAALRAGALPELLGEDGGAIAEDATMLPEAIRRAMGMDREAVRRRAQHFTLEAMVGAYEAILGELVGDRERARSQRPSSVR